jgi:cobalt-zinc-cadmium efflux system membrane fusion protein
VRASTVALLLLAAACRREPTSSDHHAEGATTSPSAASADSHEHHDALPRKLVVAEQVLKDAKLVLAPAKREALSETLSLPGEIAADPDQVARIASPAAGRIEEVRVKEGANVKKGDVLVVVRVPELGKVRSAFTATEGRAAAARANAERLAALLEKRLASEQEALNAKTEAETLAVEARSLKDQLGAFGAGAAGTFSVALRAPISGTVIGRDAVVGQPVTPEQTLGTVAALDDVWFLGRVFEKDLGRLRVGAPAEIRLNAYAGERFAGPVEYVGQQVDPSARTLTARVRLRNRDGLLRLGLFGTAQVALPPSDAERPRLVIPRSAVTELGGKSVVFVREPDGSFALHDVTLGQEAPGKIEVLEGLREGESVVSEGAFSLKSLVLKGSFAEEEH